MAFRIEFNTLTILATLTVSVGTAMCVTFCILYCMRYSIQPLRSRSFAPMVTAQVFTLGMLFTSTVPHIPALKVSCVADVVMHNVFLLMILNVYLFRGLRLICAHHQTSHFAQHRTSVTSFHPTKPSCRDPIKFTIYLVQIRVFEWLWLCLVLIQILPIYGVWAMFPEELDRFPEEGHDCSVRYIIEIYMTGMVVFFCFLAVWATINLIGKEDEFWIRREFNITCLFALPLCVLRCCTIQSEHDLPTLVAALSSCVLCFFLMSVSVVYPVILSYIAESLPARSRNEMSVSLSEQVLQILASSTQRDVFKRHLCREFCVENLLFYEATLHYREHAEALYAILRSKRESVLFNRLPDRSSFLSPASHVMEREGMPDSEAPLHIDPRLIAMHKEGRYGARRVSVHVAPSHPDIIDEAECIWDLFLSDSAEMPLNISNELRVLLMGRMIHCRQKQRYPAHLFNEGSEEVLRMMASDSLMRFKRAMRARRRRSR
eukprot:35769_1